MASSASKASTEMVFSFEARSKKKIVRIQLFFHGPFTADGVESGYSQPVANAEPDVIAPKKNGK